MHTRGIDSASTRCGDTHDGLSPTVGYIYIGDPKFDTTVLSAFDAPRLTRLYDAIVSLISRRIN